MKDGLPFHSTEGIDSDRAAASAFITTVNTAQAREAPATEGSGVPRMLAFLGNCEVFVSNRDPTPLLGKLTPINHRDAEVQRFTEKDSVYLSVSVSLW
jgi:hypothetical protein